ncbi:hypothetical protein D3C71_1222940 [compost metagenome]
MNPEQHLLGIDRLGHIIVGPEAEALLLILRKMLGCSHQNRNHAAGIPKLLGELVPVHVRHHNIKDDEVDMLLFEHVHCPDAVFSGGHLVSLAFQHGFKQSSGMPVIFHN